MTKDIGVDANINRVRIKEVASPASPTSGYGYIYAKTDGLYFKGDDGIEIGPLASRSSILASTDPYGLFHRLDTADADDDEFDDASIAGGWTQVDPTGTATWVEANHVLNVVYAGQAANDVSVILKASTLADGESYETCFRNIMLKPASGGFNMAGGLVVSDGTVSTSNAMVAMCYMDIVANLFNIELWSGTLTNLSVSGTNRQYVPFPIIGKLKLRLLRNSSTSFSCLLSTEDGAQFNAFGASVMNPGFTPTHAGLMVSAWGGTSQTALTSFDYFRVIAP